MVWLKNGTIHILQELVIDLLMVNYGFQYDQKDMHCGIVHLHGFNTYRPRTMNGVDYD